jgi:hypothetical protein
MKQLIKLEYEIFEKNSINIDDYAINEISKIYSEIDKNIIKKIFFEKNKNVENTINELFNYL